MNQLDGRYSKIKESLRYLEMGSSGDFDDFEELEKLEGDKYYDDTIEVIKEIVKEANALIPEYDLDNSPDGSKFVDMISDSSNNPEIKWIDIFWKSA